MTHKLEHKFFIPYWQLDFAKYNFAKQSKIKGFRIGKIDSSLMTIIDIRYKDQIFNQLLEENLHKELYEINLKNPIESYSTVQIRDAKDNKAWEISLIIEVQDPITVSDNNQEVNCEKITKDDLAKSKTKRKVRKDTKKEEI